MKQKLIIISGCPRSGTSLMMDCLRNMLKDGENRLIGYKFPMQFQRNQWEVKRENETTDEYNIRMYIDSVMNPDIKNVIAKSIELNPNGFFEHHNFSVKGLNYNFDTIPIIKDFQNSHDKKFAKIVSQGLNQTCPEYIDRVIYMLRSPDDVAKSQENLMRNGNYKLSNGKEIDIFENTKINDPSMFINVTVLAARFFIENPTIPVTFVKYNELVEKPYSAMQTVIEEFLDEVIIGQHPVNVKLRRSESEKNDIDPLFQEAYKVYELFCEKKFNEVIEYGELKYTELQKRQKSWFCLRTQQLMNQKHCENCFTNYSFKDQLKKHASKMGIKWRQMPCAYECAYKEGEHKTIAESIERNHWWTPDIKIVKS